MKIQIFLLEKVIENVHEISDLESFQSFFPNFHDAWKNKINHRTLVIRKERILRYIVQGMSP